MRSGFASFLILGAAVCAAAPQVSNLAPHGAQRGTTFKLVLEGRGLAPGSKLETTLPASISRLTAEPDSKPDASLSFLVELKKDAAIGVYPVRVLTDDGLSNLMLFSVGSLPDCLEKEIESPKPGNGETATAEAITIPIVINGELSAADVDLFSFRVTAGQKVVFETEAAALGSAVDPALEILDANGKHVARNDDAPGAGIDARLEVKFTRAGTYYVRVHDSKYSDQSENFYRLKIGTYSFAEAIFPIGGKRGRPAAIELVGGTLPTAAIVTPDTNLAGDYAPVAIPGSASLPFRFILSDKPERGEPSDRKLPPAVVINGRISAKGEVDRYTLAVKPGQQWLIEILASSTGASQLDALVTIFDPDGKKLVSRDDLFGADPTVPFEVPAGIESITIAVEDLLGRGGPAYGYRLEARREMPDFTLHVNTPYVNVPAGGTAIVNIGINRRGYDGAMQIDIPNLPAGYRQRGGTVAPAAASQRFDDPNPRFNRNNSVITITADADAKPQRLDLTVRGVADLPDGGRIVRFADAPGLIVSPRGTKQRAIMASWLGMGLPMASAKPLPARLSTGPLDLRIAQGVEYPLNYKVTGPARVKGMLRSNIATQIGNLRILQGEPSKSPASGQLLINTNFSTPATPWDFLPQITVEADGESIEIYGPMITLDTVPGYVIQPASTAWSAAPGSQFPIAGNVYREPTFEGGLVTVEIQDLPEGVTCAGAEVPAEAREFKVKCEIAAGVAKGSHEVRLVSAAPDTGRKAKDTYKGPEVTGTIKVE